MPQSPSCRIRITFKRERLSFGHCNTNHDAGLVKTMISTMARDPVNQGLSIDEFKKKVLKASNIASLIVAESIKCDKCLLTFLICRTYSRHFPCSENQKKITLLCDYGVVTVYYFTKMIQFETTQSDRNCADQLHSRLCDEKVHDTEWSLQNAVVQILCKPLGLISVTQNKKLWMNGVVKKAETDAAFIGRHLFRCITTRT